MPDKKSSSDKAANLRRQAEEVARQKAGRSPRNLKSLSPAETELMIHELEVHQIELEMQNEELRRVQKDLEESRERYFSLYDLAPIGYLTVSQKGLILEANLTAAALLGVSRGQLINSPISLFIFKEDQDSYYLHRKRLNETAEPQACELRMLKKDATLIWAHLEATAFQAADSSPVCRVMLSDITERKKLEEKVNELYAKEKKRRKALEEEAKARIRFIHLIGHELKGPLTPILASSGMLQEMFDPDTESVQKKLAGRILVGSRQLNSRLDELLETARSAGGAFTLNREPTALPEFIKEVVSRYQPSIDQANQSLILEIADDLPRVPIDRSRMEQVLINLLSNASKYSPAESNIRLYASLKKGGIWIAVKDEGMGISPEDQESLFQPYHRVGREQNKIQGLGLGLTVVKQIVKAHGGEVRVTSGRGKGSTFSFSIPLS